MFKKIVVAGGSGFLGRSLIECLSKRGYNVTVLSRSAAATGVTTVQWDGKTLGDWRPELEVATAVINPVAKSVNCRYTPANRREILQSRLDSVRVLGEAIAAWAQPPGAFIQAA